jgi:hypothetical protein
VCPQGDEAEFAEWERLYGHGAVEEALAAPSGEQEGEGAEGRHGRMQGRRDAALASVLLRLRGSSSAPSLTRAHRRLGSARRVRLRRGKSLSGRSSSAGKGQGPVPVRGAGAMWYCVCTSV